MKTGITITHGREGPEYDPYAVTEITVRLQDGRWATAHHGLGDWVDIGLRDKTIHRVTYADASGGDQAFADWVDITPQQAERALRKKHEAHLRLHAGHGPATFARGYPGESFTVCGCGEVLDYYFNEDAVI